MDTLWKNALWQQFGAAIDAFENALLACPDALWRGQLWSAKPAYLQARGFPLAFSEFWYLTYHTLVWLDLYLSGVPEEQFAPPAPFVQGAIDSAEAQPEQPYTREQLHAYLASLRQKCHDTLAALTDEQARQPVEYPWLGEHGVNYLELQLYNLRHVQEHAAQLSLFLGQHGIRDEALDWVPRATGDQEDH
jgi:hypothetical protein